MITETEEGVGKTDREWERAKIKDRNALVAMIARYYENEKFRKHNSSAESLKSRFLRSRSSVPSPKEDGGLPACGEARTCEEEGKEV